MKFSSNFAFTKTDEMTKNSPIEQVRLTVPITDDPTLPTLTFRSLVLGLTACVILNIVDQIFGYRQVIMAIPRTCVQVILIGLAKPMAAALPSKSIRISGTSWSFSLNPCPFNVKENVLLSYLSGATASYSVAIIAVRKVYYGKPLNFVTSLLLVITTQI